MAPLLEVVTRCYQRPAMLRHNCASIDVLGRGVHHSLLVDDVGRGIPWAYCQLAKHDPVGEYLWVLDDDDLCIYPDLLVDLRIIDELNDPDVVMVKMDHGNGVILPDKFVWGKAPERGHIGVSAFIVARRIWREFRHAFALNGGHYSSDFDFIDAVFASDPKIYWWDIIASKVQRVSEGKPE